MAGGKLLTVALTTVQDETKLKSKKDWAKPHIPKVTVVLEDNPANQRLVLLLNRLVIGDDILTEVQVSVE